jgi:hypothetical protein
MGAAFRVVGLPDSTTEEVAPVGTVCRDDRIPYLPRVTFIG